MYEIPLLKLLWILIPFSLLCYFFIKWKLHYLDLFVATTRMVLQLLLVGFFLIFIFDQNSPLFILLIFTIMLLFASLIGSRPVKQEMKRKLPLFIISIGGSGTFVLVIVIFLILDLDPWYDPRLFIPIAGMALAHAMNSLSLAAERFQSEKQKEVSFEVARKNAFQAALIPLLNSFLAVGFVSLPGMMTGQIISGVSPLIAVRYQILIMLMLLCTSGLSIVSYFLIIEREDSK